MPKISLNSLVKPKVFWPIIIILLIVSTTFYILKEKEKGLRIFTQRQLNKTIEEKKLVEDKLTETNKAKQRTELELAAEKERVVVIEKELEEKERQIKLALDRLEREITARRKAEEHLMIVMREKEILEAKVERFDKAAKTKAAKTVELEKIVVKPASGLVGKVIVVNKEYAFVVIDLGARDNLESGEILSVYRNDEFIGRVQVEKVVEKVSAAGILPEWKDVEFKENDVVKKI